MSDAGDLGLWQQNSKTCFTLLYLYNFKFEQISLTRNKINPNRNPKFWSGQTKVGKLDREKSKSSKQPKLTDFHTRGKTEKTPAAMAEEGARGGVGMTDEGTSAALAVINSIRTEFSAKFDSITTMIENMRKEISDCTERVSHIESFEYQYRIT